MNPLKVFLIVFGIIGGFLGWVASWIALVESGKVNEIIGIVMAIGFPVSLGVTLAILTDK